VILFADDPLPPAAPPDPSLPPPHRPALRYYGGKWNLGPWIIGHFPPHTCYVEPFGGAGSVLLQKPPAEYEYLNDADGDVINFFRVLREQPDDLLRLLRLTPFSRHEARAAMEPTLDPVERARRLYVRAWQSRGAARAQWHTGWRYQVHQARGKRAAADFTDTSQLDAVIERLRRVSIECDDAFAVLARFDSPATLFYVDPPYLAETRSRRWCDHAYAHDFHTVDDHRRLADTLLAVAGMVVLSGYPSELYRTLYEDRGWRVVSRLHESGQQPHRAGRGSVAQPRRGPSAGAALPPTERSPTTPMHPLLARERIRRGLRGAGWLGFSNLMARSRPSGQARRRATRPAGAKLSR